MHARNTFRVAVLALALMAVTVIPNLAAAEEVNMFDGQWRANARIYGWFPNMNTTFKVPAVVEGGTATVEVKPSSYFSDLQFAAMLAGELRKGRLVLRDRSGLR